MQAPVVHESPSGGHTHRQARLKAQAGVLAGSVTAPQVIETSSPRAVWPLSQVIETRAPLVVEDLQDRFVEQIVGPWGETTSEALIVPLGGLGDSPPIGVLVFGLNRRRPLDAPYREFLELVGAQVSAGVVGAHAFETSRARADASGASAAFAAPASRARGSAIRLLVTRSTSARQPF